MAEKTIIGKMNLYETMTMIVPGTMIVFCLWLADPELWSRNIARLHLPEVNYLLDVAIGIILLALAYIAGLLNYLITDGIWKLAKLRNNTLVLRKYLRQVKKEKMHFDYLKQLIETREKVWKVDIDDDNSDDLIEDIYYEAYTYALERNTRSNVIHVEHQVSMLKGLIFPLSWLTCELCPDIYSKSATTIGIVILLIVMAVVRQKKTITLVFEDYEYEKRIENK